MPYPFRYAICNEVFQDWDFAKACKEIKAAGYDGIEIAPFTLADDPASITPARRREVSRIVAGEGLEFVGLHWLMVAPKGLHVTTAEHATRARGWLHIHSLIDLCGDLGDNGKLIFGSPKQRGSDGGANREQATGYFLKGLSAAAARAESRGVTLLVEALPVQDTDVVNSLEEAVAMVNTIGSPAVRSMFDVHNAINETEPHATLVDKYFDYIAHVHVNELDGRCPGSGTYDFPPLFAMLAKRNYTGWVSLEVFDFLPDAVTIARNATQHLRKSAGAA